jgi:hypothetical protein
MTSRHMWKSCLDKVKTERFLSLAMIHRLMAYFIACHAIAARSGGSSVLPVAIVIGGSRGGVMQQFLDPAQLADGASR